MKDVIITKPGDYSINITKDSRVKVFIVQIDNQPESINCQINLKGEAAEVEIVSGFWQDNADQSQLNIAINHQAKNTRANFIMKGVLNGKAKEVFHGLIKIDKNAQQVESFLEHRTLLLSDEATVEPVPSLQIHANDVKASHAATISGLSDEDRFYLQTRGLKKSQIDRMLVKSFLSPVLDLLPVEPKKLILTKI